MAKQLSKNFSQTYLYNANIKVYEKNLVEYLMTADRIDKKGEAFADIRYDVKRRQVSPAIMKVLDSDAIVLMIPNKPVAKAFKVFCSKDVKDGGKLKVFIDCDNITLVNGKYVCRNVDILIAHLVAAMTNMIYFKDPKRLITKDGISKSGAECFSNLLVNIIDYLYKVSGRGDDTRDKLLYACAVYYQVNLLGKELGEQVYNIAKKITALSDIKVNIVNAGLDEDDLVNIDLFVKWLANKFNMPKLTLEVILEKWLYLYGVGTQFALEMFPSFAQMISNVYVGCYINNQKTIEKIAGKTLVTFTNTLLQVGGESV